MRREYDTTARLWIFGALAFFGVVILYFLAGKVLSRPQTALSPGLSAPPLDLEPTASPLPTAPVRMKIKRIEPRKYRREGALPPPPAVR